MKDQKRINLGVFGSSRDGNSEEMLESIREIGNQIDLEKYNITYGGGTSGIMSMIPVIANKRKGKVIGYNWKKFVEEGDEVIGKQELFDTFRDRQYQLLINSDIFLCLPGGFGSLSELVDVLMNNASKFWKKKKIIVFNYQGFYNPVKEMMSVQNKYGFLHFPEDTEVVFLDTSKEIIDYLNNN